MEDARILAEVKEADLADTVGLSVDALQNYKKGLREWGARDLAVAGVVCGKRPDELLLKSPPPIIAGPQFSEFDSGARAHVTNGMIDLAYLTNLLQDAPELFAKLMRQVADKFRSLEAEKAALQTSPIKPGTVPPGGTLEQPEEGVIIANPPPEETKRITTRRRRNIESAKVSESHPKYGKEK